MDKVLTIIRGLPGSGKSTLAKAMIKSGLSVSHFEADMYFEQNKLAFNGKLLKNAHSWCKSSVEGSLKNGDNVIVSNTFTTQWEVDPYLKLAEKYNFSINLIECKGNFGSVHNVPPETIEKMRLRWEELKIN